MREEFYMPLWIKALLGFGLVMTGILFTFIVFRFFPIPNQTGFDGLDVLFYVFLSLGAVRFIFIIGLVMDRKHPYSLFGICLGVFTVLLILIRLWGA